MTECSICFCATCHTEENLFPCLQQPRALQPYVSFLIYRPPSLMAHSGRDLFVVSVTPTLVNKVSLPRHQSGSCRWQALGGREPGPCPVIPHPELLLPQPSTVGRAGRRLQSGLGF